MSLDCSKQMQIYFDSLESYTNVALKIAEKARKKGFDPKNIVEVSIAKNAAERVVGLLSILAPQIKGSGVTERITELEKKYGALDWRVAMVIAHEIALQKYCKFKDSFEAIEIGVRTGFAYVTLGVVSSPIEGLTKVEIKKRRDGKGEYFSLKYAGPIRNAGGTMAAVSVLIADYVRKKLGYAEYDPDEKEIQRTYAELEDYNTYVTNLQYFPSKRETEFLTSHIPIEVAGDPTEARELSSARLKDLPRIETNLLRSGFCLVHSSCIPLKAPKIWKQLSKWGNDFDLEQWNFLEEFIKLQKEEKAKGQSTQKEVGSKIKPDGTFIKDMVAGRPVFGYPMSIGAFRLRYGRARVSGYSAQCVHPATMIISDNFIALGTQLKVERPGKGTAMMSSDYIDGPIVKLKDGSVVFVEKFVQAKKLVKEVEEIIFFGDVLINYGDFLDRAHILAPAGYCQEFWIMEFEKRTIELFGSLDFDKLDDLLGISDESLRTLFSNPIKTKISAEAAFKISALLDIPVHSRYDFYWSTISKKELRYLFHLIKHIKIEEDENSKVSSVMFSCLDEESLLGKRTLELLGIPHHFVDKRYAVLDKDYGQALLESLNISSSEDSTLLLKELDTSNAESFSALTFVNKISKYFFRDKAGLFIGSRMGRPEKAKMRKMKGSPHGLFPVGEEGGKLRSFQCASGKKKVTAEFHNFWCDSCNKVSVFSVCETCGKKLKTYLKNEVIYTKHDSARATSNVKDLNKKYNLPEDFKPVEKKSIPINDYIELFRKKAGLRVLPDLIKGVRGTFNEDHIPEHLVKALLRAKHKIYVNKDGTTRYDCSELTLTHFKPSEIKTSVEKLKKLGYTHDVYGKPLSEDNQILELKVQDIVIPACPDSPEEPSDIVLFRTSQFIDDLLIHLYDSKPFFNLKTPEDLVGHLVVGLAPHTSAGMVGRIIGRSKTQAFLAHPLYHAAMRRDCDGDESCFLLLMDAFLNFSIKYLPSSRGSTMDAPIVLTVLMDPAEVDDMAFNVDRVFKYPLEFYMATLEYKYPWDVKIQTINDVLGTTAQFEGMGFTHNSTDINQGVLCSAYKILPSMSEKLDGQLKLAEKIRAVDAAKVAQLVIERHFIRDTKGNLRKFSMQKFRCGLCNEKYRRPPLTSRMIGEEVYCPVCKKGKIIFTISHGSIIKYLMPSLNLAKKYNLPLYLKQTLDLLSLRVEDVFGKEKEKQSDLASFF